MDAQPVIDQSLFRGGPPDRLQRAMLLIRDGEPHRLRRCLVALLIIWVPLFVLTAVNGSWRAFFADYGAQTRFLLVPPLLILAQGFCWPRLGALAAQFFLSGLIKPVDQERYREAFTSTQRLMNSAAVEAVVIVLAYLIVAALLFGSAIEPPAWHGVRTATGFALHPAGWWAALVSLPMLLVLQLGWVWRLGLWTRFLWRMNKLDLRLIASHPDHGGGLRFLGYSVRAFLPVGFVFGVMVAGPVLDSVVHLHSPLTQFKYLAAGTAALVIAVVAGPLLIFMFRLIEVQRQGMFTYGTLAVHMGDEFEAKWLRREHVSSATLSVPDFSSTTDLYSIVANVYAMTIIPLDLMNLLLLLAATLLPFLPVVLMSAPLDVLLQKLAGLFL